ncbi:MAG: hypothetical protein ABEI99_07520 [Halobaculum sp.]
MALQTPEFTVSVAALVVVMLAVNLLLLAYALSPWSSSGTRSHGTDSGAEADRPTRQRRSVGASDQDEIVIRCPGCGTENDPDYRFCRQCVSELPVGLSRGDGRPLRFGQVLR